MGEKSVRRRGWTALLVAAVVEIAVLGGVGIYAAVAGGPTFASRAWLNEVLRPTPSPTQPVDAKPVELEPCDLVPTAELNLTLGTRFLAAAEAAGPGVNVGFWTDTVGWWTSCTFEEYPATGESLEVLVFTGPDLGPYVTARDDGEAIADLGVEAWSTTDSSDQSVTIQVRTESAVLALTQYFGAETADVVKSRLTTVARQMTERLPDRPEITPMRVEETCSAFPLDGFEEFFGAKLEGGRELRSAEGADVCTFAGDYGAVLSVSVYTASSIDEQVGYYREDAKRIAGLGDEAYLYEPEDPALGPFFLVRQEGRAVEVNYGYGHEDLLEEGPKPTPEELAALRSLLGEGDVIGG